MFHLTYRRWTSSLPSCLWSLGIFPSLPGSRLTIFYRDASSVLLQLVNQWLNIQLRLANPTLTLSLMLNLDLPTPADREVSIHGWRLVIAPCGLVMCACRTHAGAVHSKMVGFHCKPLCFCGSDLQTGSQFLHVQDNIHGLRQEHNQVQIVIYTKYTHTIIYKYMSET